MTLIFFALLASHITCAEGAFVSHRKNSYQDIRSIRHLRQRATLPHLVSSLPSGLSDLFESLLPAPPVTKKARLQSEDLYARLVAYDQRSGADPIIERLIADLSETEAPFNEAEFGEGLWVARYILPPGGGAESNPRWLTLANYLPFLDNLSGQKYQVSPARTVLNYSEIVGQRLWIAARGSFSVADEAQDRCPKDFDVLITSAEINLLGVRLPIPVSGKGLVRVLYSDASLRIFVSPNDTPDKWEERGLIVVQIPAAAVIGNRINDEGW
eukprot:CAMPEP_0185759430 /NCGR_PEP_ID=MMETSP1174-20130828/18170_1 /TAXON_ID=35687 /ORGANISM="Dictyocha speculum, Strain CCMP1381" /LENGTH=269 /DNA_ID=CAMNT_0028439765 /DNA_START=86 /DNA_END=892 /DNA_ORIENTATION=+